MKELVTDRDLMRLAREARIKAGLTQVQAAEMIGVRQSAVSMAENDPEASLTGLRIRMIETFSGCRVKGPFYRIDCHEDG